MDTRGRKRQRTDENLQAQVAARRSRSSRNRNASHTATSQLPSNDSSLLIPPASLSMDGLVQNISTAILSQVESTIRREVTGQLRAFGFTGPNQTSQPSDTPTVPNIRGTVQPGSGAVPLETITSTAASTANSSSVESLSVTSSNSAQAVSTGVGVSAALSSPIMTPSLTGNQFSIPALALDIAHVNDHNLNKPAFTSVALPLHATVSQKVKDKIWSNEYVELSTVFNEDMRVTSQISLNFSESGASVNTSSRRRFITIEQWTDLFAKYASVMRLKYPDLAEALAKYSDTVRFIAKSNGNWHLYDTEFRKLRQTMALSWDTIQHELYFKCLMQKTSLSRRKQDTRSSSDTNQQPKKFCFKFNKGEHCSGCSYQHACSNCEGTNHGLFRCFKRGKPDQGKREQQSDFSKKHQSGSSETDKSTSTAK